MNFCLLYFKKVCGRQIQKGAIYIFKRFLNKKKNSQPENARIARRIVTLTKLAELYNVPLSEENAAGLAGRIAEITDEELIKLSSGAYPIIGCPVNIIPLFAGYSQHCSGCPYYLSIRNEDKQNGCALKEEKSK